MRGLSEVPISTEGQLWDAMRLAEEERRVGSTASNDRSSRSHAIFSINVRQSTVD